MPDIEFAIAAAKQAQVKVDVTHDMSAASVAAQVVETAPGSAPEQVQRIRPSSV